MAEFLERQILVKTPVTTNGTNPLIGEDGRMVYRETILAATARPHLEKLNNTLPKQLQHVISDYKPENTDKKSKNDKD